MKRPVLVALCLIAVCAIALGQENDATPGGRIKDVKTKLKAAQQQDADYAAQFKNLESRLDDIKFAADAYKKQNDRWKQDADNLNVQIRYHNDHMCTEKCVNGKCDGTCQWYRDEAERENSGGAQLKQQADLLEQIRNNVLRDTQDYAERVKALAEKSDENTALIDRLKAQLLDLLGRYDQCRGSIPANCDAPNAVGPDGKPVLKAACERMHAKCGRMFDGN
jgi:peptidoglycan hydrolase CwlO-like protein